MIHQVWHLLPQWLWGILGLAIIAFFPGLRLLRAAESGATEKLVFWLFVAMGMLLLTIFAACCPRDPPKKKD
jgi:hypothetical protein